MKLNKVTTIAVAKGYLFQESIRLLTAIGIQFAPEDLNSRKLYVWDKSKQVKLLQVRPWDVPAYVEHGAADLGVVGKDVIVEKQHRILELMDLKFGWCRLVIAGPKSVQKSGYWHGLKVATKYPHSCEQYFQEKGVKMTMLKLYGAVELAPITGMTDVICDLVATGKTLKENHLHIIDTIFESTARLIANEVSFKTRHTEIVQLVDALSTVV